MLVLTRRVGESLVIGEDVVVTVVAQKGGQVRIGIDAPNDVSIQREELLASSETQQGNDFHQQKINTQAESA